MKIPAPWTPILESFGLDSSWKPKTREIYLVHARRFARIYADPSAVSEEDVRVYVTRPCGIRSRPGRAGAYPALGARRSRIKAIRAVLVHAVRLGCLPANPALGLNPRRARHAVMPTLEPQWASVLETFLGLAFARSGSTDTTDGYRWTLGRFFRRYPDPAKVGPPHVTSFIYAPTTRGSRLPTPQTIVSRLSPIRGFFETAIDLGLLAVNPAARVKRPRLSPSTPRGLDVDQLHRLLEAIPAAVAGERLAARRALRLRAMTLLAVYSGLRCKEITSLRAGSLSYEPDGSVFANVRAKGGQHRKIAIPPPVLVAIRELLAERGVTLERMASEESLWGLSGLADGTFVRNLRKVGAAAGLGRVTPHTLRHASCQLLRQLGASLETVSAHAGHSALSVTDRYLKRLLTTAPGLPWDAIANALDHGLPNGK